MKLSNQIVLVIGGGSGIGFAIARAATAAGARVVLAGRSRARLEQAAVELGADARAISADVSREDDVQRLFDELGNIDHVVSTAIEPHYAPIASMALDGARRLVESKLFGALLLAKHGAKRLPPTGSLVFTSGIAADRPMPNGSMVAAVNGALASFVRAAALELAPIRVNALSPGWVDTAVWDRIAGDGKAALFAQMSERLPTRRIGQPDDLAHAALFLMENAFTTGVVLEVDGGHRLV